MHAATLTPFCSDVLDAILHNEPGEPSATFARDSSTSDEALMLRYQSGNHDAFRPLYLRYRDRLHRFILRMTSTGDAEEVFQEVWLAVIRGKDRYQPSAKFVTYLFAIAHRRVIDRLRLHRHMIEDPLPEAETDSATFADEAQRPDGILQSMQAAQALLQAIDTLPTLQREAFLLQAEGEMTVDEIAQATGTHRETAKSRLRYANRLLRRLLGGRL